MEITAKLPSIHLRRIDRLLVAISLTISTLFLVVLTQPTDSIFRRDIRQVARLSEDSDQVKRKFSGSISWSEINQGSILYQHDEVYTGTDSYAKIVFSKNNSTVKLPPKSLILIEEINGKIGIEVKEGVVEINLIANGTMTIKKGIKIYSISSTKNANITLSSVEGELLISSNKDGLKISSSTATKLINKNNEVTTLDDDLKSSKNKLEKIAEKSLKSQDKIVSNAASAKLQKQRQENQKEAAKKADEARKMKNTSYLRFYVMLYAIFCIIISALPTNK
jgi:hypothetical protein